MEPSSMTAYELYLLVCGHWKRLALGLVLGVVAGLVAGAILPAYYRATVSLSPSRQLESSGGPLSSLGGQFGGLASLVGVTLGATGGGGIAATLETLRGQSFLVSFAKRRGLVVPMFAGRSWNPATGTWNIDRGIYDTVHQQWVGSVWRAHTTPTDGDIYRRMLKRFSVDEDRRSGIIRVVVESKSPELAAQWAVQLVRDLNDYLRARDSAEARKTIDYLREQVLATQVTEMQAIFYRLIEEQTKTLMLAKVRDDYALKVVDAPLVPDRPAWPRRGVLAFLGGLAGLALVFLALLTSRAMRKAQGHV
jgi:uncharacterized protein involved in exopolysaccharide biosynthesis